MTSPRTRLIRLLDRGFYPVELPPTFRTRRFSGIRNTLSPPNNYHGSTTFFDGATFRGALRTFGVINPTSYMLLSRFIADNWGDISAIFKLSTFSGARPKFPALAAEGRAIHAASLAAKRSSQRHLASVFPVILSLDINRFYGSIYTHSIPWAALGKHEAKRRFRDRTLGYHWSNTLDKLARNCNQMQTVGIPIGPDTSRIISELILSRIDAEVISGDAGLLSRQIFHNIDDYQFGSFDLGGAENAQSCFVRAISRYEFRLNDFKTSVDHGLDFTPSNFQRQFDVLRGQNGKNLVEHFFDILYAQIRQHPNTNVVGYALKRFARQLARNAEQDLVREYLQRLIFAAPHQARWVFPLLLGIYRQSGTNTEVRSLIHWGVETCARRNDVGSLLWYLYAAIFLEIRLDEALSDQCLGMSNEMIDLVMYHGRHLRLFNFRITHLRRRYSSSDFKSPAWLPLYEIARRGWDTSSAFDKIGGPDDADGLYLHMRDNDVEFYVADQECFDVEAFQGWNLEQADFDEDAREPQGFGARFGIDYGDEDDWENYE